MAHRATMGMRARPLRSRRRVHGTSFAIPARQSRWRRVQRLRRRPGQRLISPSQSCSVVLVRIAPRRRAGRTAIVEEECGPRRRHGVQKSLWRDPALITGRKDDWAQEAPRLPACVRVSRAIGLDVHAPRFRIVSRRQEQQERLLSCVEVGIECSCRTARTVRLRLRRLGRAAAFVPAQVCRYHGRHIFVLKLASS